MTTLPILDITELRAGQTAKASDDFSKNYETFVIIKGFVIWLGMGLRRKIATLRT